MMQAIAGTAPGQAPYRSGALRGYSGNWIARWLDSRRAVHFIVALAVILRCAVLGLLAHQPLAGDATYYHDFALRLLQGKTIYPFVPPSVGFYLAFVYRLLGTSPVVARASMMPLAIGSLYVLYLVSARLTGRKGANLVVLVFAIYPLNVLCSVEPITETPASLLLLISLFLVLGILAGGRLTDFVLLGMVLGLLILTRPSALLMLAFLPLYLGLRSRKWLASALVVVIPTLMITAWILQVRNSTGHFVMINVSSSQNVFLGNNAYTPLYRTWWCASHADQEPAEFQALITEIRRLPWYEQNAIYQRSVLQAITSRPDLFAVRTANRLRTYFAFDSYTGSVLMQNYNTGRQIAYAAVMVDGSLYILVALSSIVFFFTGLRHRDRFWPTLTIVGMIVIYGTPYFLSVSHPIYHYPIVPLMGILAAALWSGLLEPADQPRWAGRGGVAKQAAMVLAVVLFAYIQVEYAIVMFLYSSR